MLYSRLSNERPDSTLWRESHRTSACKPPFSESCAEHLSTSKLAQQACLRDSHLEERMASAEIWTPLASFNVRGPLPLSRPELEARVAIWRDHTERCGNLKAKRYCASNQESRKDSMRTYSICQSGFSKCSTPSSPGKLKGHQCIFGSKNLAPINLMSPGY